MLERVNVALLREEQGRFVGVQRVVELIQVLKLGAQVELRDRDRVIKALTINIDVLIAQARVFQVPDRPVNVINGVLREPTGFIVPLKTRQDCTDIELGRSYMGKWGLVLNIRLQRQLHVA